MVFFKKKEKPIGELSLRQLEEGVAKFLTEQGKKNPHLTYRVLLDETGVVSNEMLTPFLSMKPTNQFVGTKSTFEFFPDTWENREKVVLIDQVQDAVDEYVLRNELFPVKDDSKEFEICYLKLEPYLEVVPDFPMYLIVDEFVVRTKGGGNNFQ